MLCLFVCYAISVDIKYKNIMLNETNTVSIIGEIDEHSTPLILHSLITMVNNHQDVYIFVWIKTKPHARSKVLTFTMYIIKLKSKWKMRKKKKKKGDEDTGVGTGKHIKT